MPIAIGAIILPSASPNLIQIRLKGLSNFEFNNPKTKKINANASDQILKDCPSIEGQNDIIKKTIKKTIPKLLFELTFLISCLIPY